MRVTRLLVTVITLALGVLGAVKPSEAVPFTVIIPSMVTINTAIVNGSTGIDIPIWLFAHEAIDLPAPGVASIATFNWPLSSPGGPYGGTHSGSYALHEATNDVTASLELRVGANGAHVGAGQVLTDGTSFGFDNGFANLPFPPNTTFLTPEQAGLHLVLHVQGWQPNFNNTINPSGRIDLFWHLAIGQHHTFPQQNLILFEPSAGPAIRMGGLGSSGRIWLEGAWFDPNLPTSPTYTPIQQVPEGPTLILSAGAMLMVVCRKRLYERHARAARN